jgi:hypothetical protein
MGPPAAETLATLLTAFIGPFLPSKSIQMIGPQIAPNQTAFMILGERGDKARCDLKRIKAPVK